MKKNDINPRLLPPCLACLGDSQGLVQLSARSLNGHRWPAPALLASLSWQSSGSLARALDGPLQHSNHQLVLCQHQGGPGGNMVLSFELWPLVEKYAGMWSLASELWGFCPAAAVAKAALFMMTYKVMTCCPGHPELPHPWPQQIAACDWRNATAVLPHAAIRHHLVTVLPYISTEVCRAPPFPPRKGYLWAATVLTHHHSPNWL